MTHSYSKLVRDNVPEIIRKKGGTVLYHTAGSDEEFWHKLKQKLQEEIDEFTTNETIENFADVVEVMDAMQVFKEYDSRDLAAVQQNKAIDRGAFNKRIIIETSS